MPPAPRNDLVTIFLTGIPGLNQPAERRPSEMLRLNMAIPPVAVDAPAYSRLGVLGGDAAGFPNGRRVGDDVFDIARAGGGRRHAADACVQPQPEQHAWRRRRSQRRAYLRSFPYLAVPHAGNR